MKNLQKGFIVPLLLEIIAVLVIGSGVYVYKNKKTETSTVVNTETQQSGQNQQQTNTQTPPVSATKQLTLTQAPPLFETPILTISPSTTAGWKTYTNDKYKFEFKYPPSFVITDYSFEMSNGSLGLVFTDKDVNFVVRNIELSEINFTDDGDGTVKYDSNRRECFYKNELSKEFYFQEEKINNYSVCSFGNGDEESYSFSYYFIHPTKNFATEIGSSTSKLILTPILSTFKFIK